jgi:ATP-dependent Clp protease protease subunit
MQYRERIIFIGDNIDEEFSNQVLASMLYLDSIDNSKKIMLYINGPGGDVRTSEYYYCTCLGLLLFHCYTFHFKKNEPMIL